MLDVGTRFYLSAFETFPAAVNQMLVNIFMCAGTLSSAIVYLASISKPSFAHTRSQYGAVEVGLETVDHDLSATFTGNPWAC